MEAFAVISVLWRGCRGIVVYAGIVYRLCKCKGGEDGKALQT